jgi:hypothetical protein
VSVSRVGERLNGLGHQFLDESLLRDTPLKTVLIFSGEHLKRFISVNRFLKTIVYSSITVNRSSASENHEAF